MNTAAWLILLLPLFSAVLIGLGAFRSRIASAVISVGAVVGSFLLTLLVIAAGGELHPSVIWLAIEGLQIDIGLQFDTLSKLMLCVVTGVAGLIHVFNAGRASAKASIASNAHRSSSKIKSSNCMRRWFFSTLSLMNLIAAQVTFLNFRRLSR